MGKQVWDAVRGQVNEVLELGPAGAVLKRGGKTPVKRRWRDTKHLVVLPVPQPQRPQRAGQRVLINAGSRPTLAYVGQQGVITTFATERSTVTLDSGLVIPVKTNHLHLLDETLEPTVPLAGGRVTEATEMWGVWQQYKTDNHVNMIGGCSEEALNDYVTKFLHEHT